METLVFLSAAVLLDALLSSGDRFITVSLHPFWIIVLLVTVQYGMKEAFMAALLASVFLLAGNMPDQSMSETLYGYILRVVYLPFLWVAAALILGSIRARQQREKQHLQERAAGAEEASGAIAKAYSRLKQTKEQLELRLAEERRSVLTVYNIAKSLETLDSADVVKEAVNLVKSALNAHKFSLYGWDTRGLQLKVAHGWDASGTYERHFRNDAPLAHSILKKRVISIVNAEDEALLAGQGMLAGPILDPKTGAIYGMLKVEDIAFVDMGIRAHETFRIVCEWIGRIYANVEKYHKVSRRPIRMPERNEAIILPPKSILPYPPAPVMAA